MSPFHWIYCHGHISLSLSELFFQYEEQLLFLNLAFPLSCVQDFKALAWQQQSLSLFLDTAYAVLHQQRFLLLYSIALKDLHLA